MPTGLSSTVANAILDAYCRSAAWTEPAEFWVKLHVGDPGSAGTANAATETARKQITFSNATGGTITNSAQVQWLSYPVGTDTISHVSFWDASTGGAFIGSDALATNRTPASGDTVTLAAGDLDLSLPIAS